LKKINNEDVSIRIEKFWIEKIQSLDPQGSIKSRVRRLLHASKMEAIHGGLWLRDMWWSSNGGGSRRLMTRFHSLVKQLWPGKELGMARMHEFETTSENFQYMTPVAECCRVLQGPCSAGL
jgi:hypothetical protein